MFRPVPMTRLKLIVLERDVRSVLRYLGCAGVTELTHAVARLDEAPLPPRALNDELARANGFWTRLENLRRSLPPVMPENATEIDEMSLDLVAQQLELLEQRSGVLLHRQSELRQRTTELTATAKQMFGYRGVDLPLDRPGESSFLHFITGSMPVKNFGRLEIGAEVALLPLMEREGQLCLIAMTTGTHRHELDQTLRKSGFQLEALPAVTGATVDTMTERNQDEQKNIASELEQINTSLQTLSQEAAPILARIERTVDNDRRLLEAQHNLPRTESSVLVTGWTPDDAAEEVKRNIRKITSGCCLTDLIPAKETLEEEIPVLLRHSRWLRPFGKLVTAYGLPKYRELEPTLFVAVSFVLMFGMMFGDVGHGAVLVAGGLVGLFATHRQAVRSGGCLLLAGGISSMIFGMLYGSCFGLETFKRFALWQDPLEGNPMKLMSVAVGTGIVLISFGVILNIINRFRCRDFIGGWLGKFGVAGLVFYWGTFLLICKLPAIKTMNLLTPGIILFIVLPVAGWLCKEPLVYLRRRRAGAPLEADSGWFSAIIESLAGAFEALLSFLANTISFVRLAAYAMSHAALLLAALMMADMVRHSSSAGTFLSVAIIVVGNIVAVLLEGVIATVQALRLEYYEFFGKFFGGDGRAFQPFRLLPTNMPENSD